MIVKTKKGFYVYSKPNQIGRRVRVGGPFTTYSQAQNTNNGTKKKTRKIKRKR